MRNNDSEKLERLRESADLVCEKLDKALDDFGELSINELRSVASILKTMAYVQRDLNALPNRREEFAVFVAEERLRFAKEQRANVPDDEQTGIIFETAEGVPVRIAPTKEARESP